MTDIYNVTNNGTSDLTLPHQTGNVVIAPGDTKTVTREHMWIAFGNPALEGRDREQELARIQTRYGFYAGIHPDNAWYESTTYHDRETGESYEVGPFCPQVSVADASGDEVVPFAADPEGNSVDYPVSTADGEVEALRGQVATLTELVTKLLHRDPEDPSTKSDAEAALNKSAVDAADEAPGARAEQPPAPRKAPLRKDGPKTQRTGR